MGKIKNLRLKLVGKHVIKNLKILIDVLNIPEEDAKILLQENKEMRDKLFEYIKKNNKFPKVKDQNILYGSYIKVIKDGYRNLKDALPKTPRLEDTLQRSSIDRDKSSVGDSVMVIEDTAIGYFADSTGNTLKEDIGENILKYSGKKAIVIEIDLKFPFKCEHCDNIHHATTKIQYEGEDRFIYTTDRYLTPYVHIDINNF